MPGFSGSMLGFFWLGAGVPWPLQPAFHPADISSPLPQPLLQTAAEFGFNPSQGARGFTFNTAAHSLMTLLTFGSVGTVQYMR